MRLWHEALIPFLPKEQLLGQHRECCALRGGGWGRKHSIVNYVFGHPYGWLVAFHFKVMDEMYHRGYNVAEEWKQVSYRGTHTPALEGEQLGHEQDEMIAAFFAGDRNFVYPEHTPEYLSDCIQNLRDKGADMDHAEEFLTNKGYLGGK